MAFRVVALVGLGLTLVFVGIVWMVFRGFCDNIIIPKYWIENLYLNIIGMEFNVIPTVILIVGVLCIVIGAAGGRQ